MEKLEVSNVVQIVGHMYDVIIENEVYFCELDSAAGDGDFGMSIAKGFRELKNEWEELPKEDIGAFLKACGMIITEYCGGASGPIWGSAFRSAAKYSKGKTELNLKEVSDLFQSSVDGIQKRGGAKIGDKTLLDALIPAAESFKISVEEDDTFMIAANKSACKAVCGAEKTREMIASKGRASYLGERSLNFPDAGAVAIGVIFMEVIKKIKEEAE